MYASQTRQPNILRACPAGKEKNSTMDPQAGDYRRQARYFAGRAVLDGAALTEAQEQLAGGT